MTACAESIGGDKNNKNTNATAMVIVVVVRFVLDGKDVVRL